MAELRIKRQIAASIEDVFHVISDMRNLSHASHYFGRVDFLSKEKLGLGVRFRTSIDDGSESTVEVEVDVDEFVEDESIGLRGDCHGVHWAVTLRLSSKRKNQCELLATVKSQPYRLYSMLRFSLINNQLAEAVETELDAIKCYCEHDA